MENEKPRVGFGQFVLWICAIALVVGFVLPGLAPVSARDIGWQGVVVIIVLTLAIVFGLARRRR